MQTMPLTRDLVLIGGGHAHALVLRRWGMKPMPGARLTLINPGATAPYTGMLPGFVAGHYTREELDIDLVKLARFAGARIVFDHAVGIDRDRCEIHLKNRSPLGYDAASIDIGITSTMPEIPGFEAYGIAAKPLGDFAARWHAFQSGPMGPVAVVGGGVGGIELALAMAYVLRRHENDAPVTVIEKDCALTGMSPATRSRLLDHVARAGIEVVEGATVREIGPTSVHLVDREIPSVFTVGAAGARPHAWLTDLGLDLHDGFLVVDHKLRTSDPRIFAAGDCCHMPFAPRPKAGVFAVRAAPVLTRNLRAALSHGPFRDFKPQRDYLKLISLGRTSALGEKFGRPFEGDAVWRLKDKIDRKFMNRLGDLPTMPRQTIPKGAARGVSEILKGQPRCGGCGSKLGPSALDNALVDLASEAPDSPGDDAAVIRIGAERIVSSTDFLRQNWLDPHSFARIATLHALGDIWAMGGKPTSALPTIVLPHLSDRLEQRWMTEIMAAVSDTLSEVDCALSGGHTTVGQELGIGLSVIGTFEGSPKTLAGASPGDSLILTRPIGSGVLMAAEMQGQAYGPYVEALISTLSRAQHKEAEVLATATAMTDVTGFGLAGHLSRMLAASQVGANLQLADIPFFDGALDLANRRIRSSLYPENRSAYPIEAPDDPRVDLLYDPQTAGGLLASVPAEQVENVLTSLSRLGIQAAAIGTVIDMRSGLRVT